MSDDLHHITKVEISGLWDKFDFGWNLEPDVNVLAGVNGSGKSTVFICIYALLELGTIPNKEDVFLATLKITFDNKKSIFYEHLNVNDSIKNIEEKAKINEKYQRVLSEIKDSIGRDYRKYRKTKSVHMEMGVTSFENIEMKLEEFHKLINIDVVSTFDNSLKQSEAVRKLSNEKVKTELDWNIHNLQKRYLDYQLNISRKKDAIVEIAGENIRRDLIALSKPHTLFLNIIDSLFDETGKKVNRNENEISFLLDNKEITPFQLSSGEKQLLIILLTVLLQDGRQSILFMDEPEISLHIEWQKKLLKFIRDLNPNVQIILATHAPGLVMQGWMNKTHEISDLITAKNEKR
ncbi:ATP-binding protein [Thiotrichales bacterium HSG1]|nr:ATP-binding protein [Thiotrichales bacterium HSG1]